MGGTSSPLGRPGAAREGPGADLRGLPWATPFRVGSGREGEGCGRLRGGPAHKPSLSWLGPGARSRAPHCDWPLFSRTHPLQGSQDASLATPPPHLSPNHWSPLSLSLSSMARPHPWQPHWLRPPSLDWSLAGLAILATPPASAQTHWSFWVAHHPR